MRVHLLWRGVRKDVKRYDWSEEQLMKLAYDARYNIAYLRLQEKTAEVETIHVSDELNVDLTPDGKIFGIELLNANEQLRDLAGGKLVLENEETGATVEVGLP